MNTAVYLDGTKLPVNPAGIRFRLPTLSATYELIGAGEAEVLQGARLAEIEIEGFFPHAPRRDLFDAPRPAEYIARIREMVEESRPVRFVYVGEGWDINMLVSVQSPVFCERGGSMDVEYEIKLRKWVEIETGLYVGVQGRDSRRRQSDEAARGDGGGSYVVKSGDTLRHIARYALGDASRWREIHALNKDVVQNPNMIYPGQTLLLPDGAGGQVPVRGGTGGGNAAKGAAGGSGKSSSGSGGGSAGSGGAGSSWTVGANLLPHYNGGGDLAAQYKRG